jgi:hypothetical protein
MCHHCPADCWNGGLPKFLPWLASNHNLLISTPQVAGITGVSCLSQLVFIFLLRLEPRLTLNSGSSCLSWIIDVYHHIWLNQDSWVNDPHEWGPPLLQLTAVMEQSSKWWTSFWVQLCAWLGSVGEFSDSAGYRLSAMLESSREGPVQIAMWRT